MSTTALRQEEINVQIRPTILEVNPLPQDRPVRRPQRAGGFLKHLVAKNPLYRKPNVAVLAHFLTVIVLAVYLFLQRQFTFFDYWGIMFAYIAHIGFQLLAVLTIYCGNKSKFKLWMIIPPLALLAEYLFVTMDYSGGSYCYSVYASPLLAVPFVFRLIPKTGYSQLVAIPLALQFFIIPVEVLLLLKEFKGIGLQQYGYILGVLVLYYLPAFVISIVTFLWSIGKCFVGCFTCFERFDWRVNLVTFFNSCDSIMGACIVIPVVIWLIVAEEQTVFNNRPRQYDQLNFNILFRILFFTGAVYSIVRFVVLYSCTASKCQSRSLQNSSVPSQSDRTNQIPSNPNPIVQRRNNQDESPRAQPERTPERESEDPETGLGRFLNLFRVSSNYYVRNWNRNQLQSANQDFEEDLCFICLDRLPNCIIMDCHHGGFCNVCGIDLAARKKCPSDRIQMKKIYVIRKVAVNKYEITDEIPVPQ